MVTLRQTVREPTLLVGAEQSGTTLLRLMLDSHPEIAFAEELEFAVEPIGHDGSYPSAEEFGRHLARIDSFSTSGFPFDPTMSFPDMVNGFLLSRQAKKRAVAVGATFRRGFTKALKLWPDAKLIHLVRDPRNVAMTRVAEGLAGNTWHALDGWIEVEDELAALAPTLGPDRVLTVRFADLIDDYDAALTTVCQFIGVDYTAQMLDYVSDTDYEAPSTSVAGDWREALTDREVRLAEARAAHRLTALGFQPSGLRPLEVTRSRLWRLRWQDRFGRTSRRVEVSGLRLTVADLVARWTHHEQMQETTKRRIRETEGALRKKSWSEAKYRTSR